MLVLQMICSKRSMHINASIYNIKGEWDSVVVYRENRVHFVCLLFCVIESVGYYIVIATGEN